MDAYDVVNLLLGILYRGVDRVYAAFTDRERLARHGLAERPVTV